MRQVYEAPPPSAPPKAQLLGFFADAVKEPVSVIELAASLIAAKVDRDSPVMLRVGVPDLRHDPARRGSALGEEPILIRAGSQSVNK